MKSGCSVSWWRFASWVMLERSLPSSTLRPSCSWCSSCAPWSNSSNRPRLSSTRLPAGAAWKGFSKARSANYLPSNWGELLGSLEGAQDAYGALSAGLRVLLEANAVLTEDELAEIPEAQRAELIAARRSTAALQALAREALAATSARFESLQALIDAIAGAEDQKAILELQARIGAEHDMLLNEQTKLELLDRGLKAEEDAARAACERACPAECRLAACAARDGTLGVGFFAEFSLWLNTILATYVAENTARLAQTLEPAVVTLGVLYIMLWGGRQITGQIREPVLEGLKRIALLAVVLGCALHLWLYNEVIVDTFLEAPTQLAAAVLEPMSRLASLTRSSFRAAMPRLC